MPNNIECARAPNFPRAGEVFTTQQVLFDLPLRDSPCLDVLINGGWHPVQTAHCTNEALIEAQGWRDATWRFVRETHEWIPIFRLERGDANTLVDHEPDQNAHRRGDLWVTPKGLPRKQWGG